MQAAQSPDVIRFGMFEADLRSGELRRNGLKVRLPEQSFQILAMLLTRARDVVTREEIRQRLWPNNTIVEFDHSINAAIKRLREALNDSADDPRFVETLARRGYRFKVAVEATAERPSPIPAPDVQADKVPIASEPEPDSGELTGSAISHYRILEKLGSGGMGIVYMAQDTTLGRRVALKFLPDELAEHSPALERFQREARSASALNYPNICTIYEVSQEGRRSFIAMELLEGQTLEQRIGGKPLKTAAVLEIAIQIADALEAAHSAGIIHRDIKPANVMITNRGQAKVLDFGLAKLIRQPVDMEIAVGAASQPSAAAESGGLVRSRTVIAIGTAAYMSPEQARGEELDGRTDLFSFGAVLYEMATGRQAFPGDTPAVIFDAILNRTPLSPLRVNPELPGDLARVIDKALEKDRGRRYQSARELVSDLSEIRKQLTSSAAAAVPFSELLRRPPVLIPLVLAVAAVLLIGGWDFYHLWRVRWARRELAQINTLIEKGKYFAAYSRVKRVRIYLPDEPRVREVLGGYTFPVTISTSPAGAGAWIKPYADAEEEWEYVGRTPITEARVPLGALRFKLTKSGYEPRQLANASFGPPNAIAITLDPLGSLPPNMVRVPGGSVQVGSGPPVQVEDFLIDRYEVTNREYKKFVDAGGYGRREFWKEKFIEAGRTLRWEDAILRFRDATGRAGPSTWELGDYPAGQDEYPVDGVSWYEAAAYAAFVGKALPTIHHWSKAAQITFFSEMLQMSNFSGTGPARVDTSRSLGPYGAFDMAGNVREWCWTSTGDRRYLLGGAWNEPAYLCDARDARSPFDRSRIDGFRCVKYLNSGAVPEALTRPVENHPTRDYTREKPVSDAVFRAYRGLYSYDRTPLNAMVESVDNDAKYWRKTRISYSAGYGNERIIAHLYLPRNVSPPYQTVIYFPHVGALLERSSEDPYLVYLDFIIRSGRALLFPVYKGTYERGFQSIPDGLNLWRDMIIDWSKDLDRSVDYLQTRNDLDREKVAFYGFSMGSVFASPLLAMEKRLRAAVLLAGGFRDDPILPEVDPINFLPRVKIPVLMINGRNDFFFPVETYQRPMFKLLGTPEKDKRYILLDSGHLPSRAESIKEILNWLDRYLGPVEKTARK